MRFKYVQQWVDRKTGRRYVKFRRPGFPVVDLSRPVGSSEFMADYFAALNMITNGKLPAIQRRAKHFAREVAADQKGGVYLLFLKRKLIYIGSSRDMRKRVGMHHANGRSFDRAFYIPAADEDRLWLERELIRTLNPPQNRNGKCQTGGWPV